MYRAEVSFALIYKVTAAVLNELVALRTRSLDSVHYIVDLYGFSIKRHNVKVINNTIHLSQGWNKGDEKELLGLWIAEMEDTKYWLYPLTGHNNSGVSNIWIVCAGASCAAGCH